MADHTATVACLPQKSESLISATSHPHRGSLAAHSHPHSCRSSNNLRCHHNHSHCSHFTISDCVGKDAVMHSKSLTAEGIKEPCNGCLPVGVDFDFSMRMGHCPNRDILNLASSEDDQVNSLSCRSRYVVNGIEKVNGLTHPVTEHSSDDNQLIGGLRNTCIKTREATGEIENGHFSAMSIASVHEPESDCGCRHLKQANNISHCEVYTAKPSPQCSPDLHCCSSSSTSSSSSTGCSQSLDALVTELEKVSVCHDGCCNELPASSNMVSGVSYVVYESERQMPNIMRLITKDLSEPYSIYTYRYFIHTWPKLCFLAVADHKCVGAIVCKLDLHKKMVRRGYIAMLAVDSEYRRRQIGSTLVTKAIEAMIRDDCDEVVLETEITNQGALHLYENLGFVRDKRLFRYYLNGVDALRLKLWLR